LSGVGCKIETGERSRERTEGRKGNEQVIASAGAFVFLSANNASGTSMNASTPLSAISSRCALVQSLLLKNLANLVTSPFNTAKRAQCSILNGLNRARISIGWRERRAVRRCVTSSDLALRRTIEATTRREPVEAHSSWCEVRAAPRTTTRREAEVRRVVDELKKRRERRRVRIGEQARTETWNCGRDSEHALRNFGRRVRTGTGTSRRAKFDARISSEKMKAQKTSALLFRAATLCAR
jgi:hypothetical protein